MFLFFFFKMLVFCQQSVIDRNKVKTIEGLSDTNTVDFSDKPSENSVENNELSSGIDETDEEINFDFEVNCKMAPWRTLDRKC